MRWMLLATVVLAGCGKKPDAAQPDAPTELPPAAVTPPAPTARTPKPSRWAPVDSPPAKVTPPVRPERAAPPKPPPEPTTLHSERGKCAKLVIEEYAPGGPATYHRLLVDEVLHGSQIRTFRGHWADQLQCLTAAHPLENLAVAGAHLTFDARQEPTAYHHRTGPVGAIFRELHARGTTGDVGVLGLKVGAEACYAQKGQKLTFYETDPAIKRLVADTDEYFTYITDARTRGATIDIRTGDRRAALKADADRKFTLLIVDPYDSAEHPTDLMPREAVQLYFDRMAADGVLAIHVSHKSIRFEPMFARIAEELKGEARIWEDDVQWQPGKHVTSWMVLARNDRALGTLGTGKSWENLTHRLMNPRPDPNPTPMKRRVSPFRPARTHPDVPAWTDARAVVVPAMEFKR